MDSKKGTGLGTVLYHGTKIVPDIKDRFASSESPKLKFNFFVKFEFRSNSPQRESLGGLSLETNYLAVKSAGRISPVINYYDVNYYGFRTKVATRTDFTTFNLTLYDDSSQRSHSVVDAYMKAVSPLADAPDADLVRELTTVQALEEGSELGIIKKMTLLHVAQGGKKKTQYQFFNPKITNIIADELDMAASDPAFLNITFVYDGYRVDHV